MSSTMTTGTFCRKALAVMRIFAGLFFFKAGLPKLGGDFYGGMGETLRKFASDNPHHWYQNFLYDTAIPNAKLFAVLVSTGEVGVGLMLVLGLGTVVACVLGTIMTVNYYFATAWMGPSNAGINLYATAVFLLLLVTQAGKTWGLDAYLSVRWNRGGPPSSKR